MTSVTGGTRSSFLNTWKHIAISRFGSTVYAFVDGQLIGTNSYNGIQNLDNSYLYIGGKDTSSYPYMGYIQDFRITKGYARYVQNFTPPTQADQLY